MGFQKKKNYYESLNKSKLLIDSKKLKKNFYESASFVIYKPNHIKKKNFSRYFGFPIKRDEAIDIDYIEDWNLAEKFYKIKYL